MAAAGVSSPQGAPLLWRHESCRGATAPLAAGAAQEDALRAGHANGDTFGGVDDGALLDLDDLDALITCGDAASWQLDGVAAHEDEAHGSGACDDAPDADDTRAPAALRCLDGSHAADCVTYARRARVCAQCCAQSGAAHGVG